MKNKYMKKYHVYEDTDLDNEVGPAISSGLKKIGIIVIAVIISSVFILTAFLIWH